jgi:hypothetical protein
MKIAKQNLLSLKKYVRNVNAHSLQAGKHGKAFEMFLADMFNFPKHEQHNAKIDFPLEIVAQGNVPTELQADWEVKFYNIKRKSSIMLGDVRRKLDCMKSGMILVVGFYDGSPENLVKIEFFKLKRNWKMLEMWQIWKETADFVKDRTKSIEQGRKRCKEVNRLGDGAMRIENLSRPERWSESKQRIETEARQVSLTINLTKIKPIASI